MNKFEGNKRFMFFRELIIRHDDKRKVSMPLFIVISVLFINFVSIRCAYARIEPRLHVQS